MQGKVEICGVNTARLKVLTQKEMDRLLLQAKDGDDNAHRNGLQEAQDAPVSGFYVQLWVNPYRVAASQLPGALPLTAGNDGSVHKGIYRGLLTTQAQKRR